MKTKVTLAIAALIPFFAASFVYADIVTFGFGKETNNGPVNEDFASQSFVQIWDASRLR